MKIKLLASDSCERGHRRGEWALGSNVKLMAGISVPVPSVNDGAIADSLGPPSESGRELQPREGFFTRSPPLRFVPTGWGSGMRCYYLSVSVQITPSNSERAFIEFLVKFIVTDSLTDLSAKMADVS